MPFHQKPVSASRSLLSRLMDVRLIAMTAGGAIAADMLIPGLSIFYSITAWKDI